MWLRRVTVVWAAVAGVGVMGAAVRGESLEGKVNGLLGSPLVKGAAISLEVVEIGKGGGGATTLVSHDATLPLGPASNCKLLTTAAAFERYGPSATFKTHLFQVGQDLLLVGGGDPGLGDAKLAAAAGQTPTAVFEQWAVRLKQAGITQYRDLIVDDRVFDREFTHPNWPADQRLDWYCAPVGGLNFNANCLDWTPKLNKSGVGVELMPNTGYVSVTIKATRGAETRVSLIRPAESNKFELRGTLAASATAAYSVPIYDPGLWTGTILRDVLEGAGVHSSSHVVKRAEPEERFANGVLVAEHQTPILDVIMRANTHSLNMMAECLCKRLGYDVSHAGTWAGGTAAVEAYVTSLGAKGEWLTLDDGSGLSNKNRVAARVFTTVLAHVAARPDGEKFIETLAVPREEGTLEKRFKGMAVAEHVRAKTGHITGVSTLSGYILMDGDAAGGGRRFAFSILVNKYQGNVNPWQDQVCEAIYDWARGK